MVLFIILTCILSAIIVVGIFNIALFLRDGDGHNFAISVVSIVISIILGVLVLSVINNPKPIFQNIYPITAIKFNDDSVQQIITTNDGKIYNITENMKKVFPIDRKVKETYWAGKISGIYYETEHTYEIIKP